MLDDINASFFLQHIVCHIYVRMCVCGKCHVNTQDLLGVYQSEYCTHRVSSGHHMNSSLPLTSYVKRMVHSRFTNAACSSESAPTANSRGSTCFPKKNVTVSTFLMDMIKSVIGVDTSLFYLHDDHHSGLSKQDLLYSLTWLTSMLALFLSMFLYALSHIANHTTVGGPGIVNTCECFFSNS